MHVMAQMVCSNTTALDSIYALNTSSAGGETLIKLILHLPSPVFPGTGTARCVDSKASEYASASSNNRRHLQYSYPESPSSYQTGDISTFLFETNPDPSHIPRSKRLKTLIHSAANRPTLAADFSRSYPLGNNNTAKSSTEEITPRFAAGQGIAGLAQDSGGGCLSPRKAKCFPTGEDTVATLRRPTELYRPSRLIGQDNSIQKRPFFLPRPLLTGAPVKQFEAGLSLLWLWMT